MPVSMAIWPIPANEVIPEDRRKHALIVTAAGPQGRDGRASRYLPK
jgi:hypothetical protein